MAYEMCNYSRIEAILELQDDGIAECNQANLYDNIVVHTANTSDYKMLVRYKNQAQPSRQR